MPDRLERSRWLTALLALAASRSPVTAIRTRAPRRPPSCPRGHSVYLARVVVTAATRSRRRPPSSPQGLSGVNELRMIIRMTTSRRPQQRYDHRLRDLVHSTGDVTIATDLGVPRSTARGWLRKAPRLAVSMDVTNLKTLELQQEILELRRRMKKLTALLRLALALVRCRNLVTPPVRTRGRHRRDDRGAEHEHHRMPTSS